MHLTDEIVRGLRDLIIIIRANLADADDYQEFKEYMSKDLKPLLERMRNEGAAES